MKWTSPAKLIVNRCDGGAAVVGPADDEGRVAIAEGVVDDVDEDTAAPVEHAVSSSAVAILVRASNRTPLRFHA